jgi:hypothetical protein
LTAGIGVVRLPANPITESAMRADIQELHTTIEAALRLVRRHL